MYSIGFIGLGMMGTPMAHLLHRAGYPLIIKDVNSQVLTDFVVAHPGVQAVTDGQSFANCEAVITMLPNSDIVDAVVRDLMQHLKPGACLIEMSSADPSRTRKLAAILQAKDIGLIDAPVSGGVKKAVSGTLAIMVGGPPQLVARYKPVLEVLGQSITHVGPVGAGHALKALNNYVSAAALLATAEAIHVGSAFGIDRETIVEVINTSTGRNNTTENKARQFMLNEAFNSGFSLALQAKDVGIAANLGKELDHPMALAQKVADMTIEASRTLGPAADHTELYRFIAIKPS